MERRQLSLVRAFILWWSEAKARYGRVAALRQLAHELVDFAKESTPQAHRARFGDIEYDCDYRVDTTAATVSLRNRLLGAIIGIAYQPCDPPLFHHTLRALPIDYSHFTFIDFGSGKGRALLMASDYPFRRIIGVELLPDLHRAAQENVRKYRSESQTCFAIELQQGDAREFVFPLEPCVLFLFNPLPEPALMRVVANLRISLQQAPRPVYIVYHNPVLEHMFADIPEMHRLGGTFQYAIYSNVGEELRSFE